MASLISPRIAFFATLILILQSPAFAQQPPVEKQDFLHESRDDFDARMQWWRDARFGMFIHWGAYAVPAGEYKGERVKGTAEWIMNSFAIPVEEYEGYARAFKPVKFDAREWVRIAKDAGMKYIIITSKHHEGFAIFDSDVSDYDITDTSRFGRDILAELSAAAHEAGIALGFYYSIMDWHHPEAQAPHWPTYNTSEKSNPSFPRYVETYLKPQVKELIEKYDPDVLWFDGEWIPEYTHEMGLNMYQFVRGLKPSILVNNRVDTGRKGMQGMNADDQDYAGDFGTPEQEILEGTSTFDWEACMTMNDTWGFDSSDDNWKSAETLIYNLIDVAAKGGNYLLNVGPTAEGLIPAPSVERLAEIGDWLAINGEAIYGSRPWTAVGEGDDVRYTSVGDSIVYAITFTQPSKAVHLTNVQPVAGKRIKLLGDDRPLYWTYSDQAGLTVGLTGRGPKNLDHHGKYAWVFRIPVK